MIYKTVSASLPSCSTHKTPQAPVRVKAWTHISCKLDDTKVCICLNITVTDVVYTYIARQIKKKNNRKVLQQRKKRNLRNGHHCHIARKRLNKSVLLCLTNNK